MFPICFFAPGIWSRTASDVRLGDGASLSNTPWWWKDWCQPAGITSPTAALLRLVGLWGPQPVPAWGGPTENSGCGGQRDLGSPGLASITLTVADSELNWKFDLMKADSSLCLEQGHHSGLPWAPEPRESFQLQEPPWLFSQSFYLLICVIYWGV